MKKVMLSDEAYAALQRLATAKNQTPSDAIADLLDASRPPLAGDNLLFFLISPEFTTHHDETRRYLSLLAWCARNYRGDFAEFIAHQESGLHYLMLGRDELNSARGRNLTRQIDGTQYWAVMNIDAAARRRFVRRLLDFIGCHEEQVDYAIRALGLAESDTYGFRLLTA
jgi:negative regulator of replication initiation